MRVPIWHAMRKSLRLIGPDRALEFLQSFLPKGPCLQFFSSFRVLLVCKVEPEKSLLHFSVSCIFSHSCPQDRTIIRLLGQAYAAVTAQAKLKREEQARQSSRQEIAHSVTEANVLTSELTDLLIEKVYVFPDNRIEIVYKVHDLFE